MINATYDTRTLEHRVVFKFVGYLDGKAISLLTSTPVHDLEPTEAHLLGCNQWTRECAINECCTVQVQDVSFERQCKAIDSRAFEAIWRDDLITYRNSSFWTKYTGLRQWVGL